VIGQQHLVLLVIVKLPLSSRELLIDVRQDLLVAQGQVVHRGILSLQSIDFTLEKYSLMANLLELLLELLDHAVVGSYGAFMALPRLLGSVADMH